MVFGKAASLIGLVVLAFAPATVALLAELREYSVAVLYGDCPLFLGADVSRAVCPGHRRDLSHVGSRHTAFLVPFAVAAASFLLASLPRQKLWAGLLLAVLLTGVSNAYGQSRETGLSRVNLSRKLMAGAVDYMEQSIPRGDLILVDYQSSMPLSYYLCGPAQTISIDRSSSDFDQFNCNGYSVVSISLRSLSAISPSEG